MPRFVSVWFALSLACLAFCAKAEIRGDTDFEYWPDAEYDLTVPEISDVVGHTFGGKMSWASDIEKYFIRLADLRLTEFGCIITESLGKAEDFSTLLFHRRRT